MSKICAKLAFVSLFAVSVFGAGEGIALKDSSCTGKFSIASQKIILPVGYYENYIKKSGSLLPHKVSFEYNSSNIDTGYIYCIGARQGANFECVNNLDEIVESKDINYVTVDKHKKTFFILNKKEATLHFSLPLIKALSSNDSLELSLLRHKESSNKEVCLSENRALKLDFEPFQLSYSIAQNIASDFNQKITYNSKVTVNNPQNVPIKVYDLYSKKLIETKEATTSMDLSVYGEKLSGFCASLDTGYPQMHLKEGSDYFCKTTTLSDFNFAVFHDALNSVEIDDKNNSFLQVGSVKLSDVTKGQLPFELLGLEKSARLIRQGYKDLKTTYIGNMIYILVGPYNQNQIRKELNDIKQFIPDAMIFDEALIKCRDKVNGGECRN